MNIGEIISIIGVVIAVLTAWITYKQFVENKSTKQTSSITLNYRREAMRGRDFLVVGDAVEVVFSIQNNSMYVFNGKIAEKLPTGITLVTGKIEWIGKLLPGQTITLAYTMRIDIPGKVDFSDPIIQPRKGKKTIVSLKCDGAISILAEIPSLPKLSVAARF